MKLWKRVRMWRDRRRFEQDLAEEIRIHREMSGAAAFGSEALALEQSRDVWGFTWLESWKQDIRYAIRGLRRSPGFTLAVIGAVGLGIGLNTTMFTVFNAYVLRPYAVRDPYSLYSFSWLGKNGNGHWLSQDDYDSVRRESGVFSDVLAFDNFIADVSGRSLFAQLVTPNYFELIGSGMEMGRPLAPGDGAVAVMSYQAWQNKFGGDAGVVGRKLYLRGESVEVVGVASRKFSGTEGVPIGLWLPMGLRPVLKDSSQGEVLRVIGRLAPGISVDAAKAGLLTWAQRRWPGAAAGIAMTSRAAAVPMNRDAIVTSIPIFTAFGIVLLIAAANVCNMMLARGLARQREMAIRVSLGAGRGRLIRQLLTECVVLSIPAGLAGFAVSEATIEGARRLLFSTLPSEFARILVIEDLVPDWRVFSYILAASVGTAMLFGLVPALTTTRSRLVEANRGDFSSDYRPARLRNLLVVGQVGVCVLLLICAAVVLRSEHRVSDREMGLDVRGVWDIRVISRHQPAVERRLLATPGVEAVAVAGWAPLYGSMRGITVTPSGSKDPVRISHNYVGAGYFDVFRSPIVRGRAFTKAEAESNAPVVVVSESAARLLWVDGVGVGASLATAAGTVTNAAFERFPGFTTARVIGVVRDARTDLMTGNAVCIYFPTSAGNPNNNSLLVRMAGTGDAARRNLQAALDRVAPSVSDFVNPMEDARALQIYPFRVTFWIAGFLGGVALLLTVSGIYGVMSYLVSQRTKEIGIRIALGAGRGEIVRMVLRQTGKLAAFGVAGGVAMALAVAPVFAHEIDALRPFEWIPYAGSAAVVLAAALLASYAPSRRAVRIDPIVTLRCD